MIRSQAFRPALRYQLWTVPSVFRAVGRYAGSYGNVLCEHLVDVHAQPGRFTRVHRAVGERVGVREDQVGFSRVPHQLLDAEVVHAETEVERGRHAHGAEVRGAVAAGADVVELRQRGDLPQMADVHRRA